MFFKFLFFHQDDSIPSKSDFAKANSFRIGRIKVRINKLIHILHVYNLFFKIKNFPKHVQKLKSQKI